MPLQSGSGNPASPHRQISYVTGQYKRGQHRDREDPQVEQRQWTLLEPWLEGGFQACDVARTVVPPETKLRSEITNRSQACCAEPSCLFSRTELFSRTPRANCLGLVLF